MPPWKGHQPCPKAWDLAPGQVYPAPVTATSTDQEMPRTDQVPLKALDEVQEWTVVEHP